MITLFNRKELLITFSMSEQAEVRNILSDNKIDYIIKTINRKSPSPLNTISPEGTRAFTGTLGENLSISYEYIIFVHRKDYEQAQFILHLK